MALTDKLTNIADAIRGKTGKTEELTLDQMATEIAGIEIGGGSGGDTVLDYAGTIKNMFYGFNTSEPMDIEISFGSKLTTNLQSDALSYVLGRSNGIKSIKVICGAPVSPVSMQNFAEHNRTAPQLEKVDLTGAVGVICPTNMTKSFYYRTGLREILGELDVSQCTTFSNAFGACDALETVRFKAGTINSAIEFSRCSNLTDATIQNIIDGLADLTGGTAQTLTLHATVGAKLTDAQKASASAKNWTISY